MRLKPPQSKAQTFVFFLVSFSTVFLLCGMGLDMGLWFLDRTRLSRACDAAAITGAANFGKTTGTNAEAGRLTVAKKMRNVAVANYYGLRDISETPILGTSTNSSGGLSYHYYFTKTGATNEAGYHVTIATGLAGQVTRAQSEAWSKTRTVFMGFTGASQLMNLNTKGTAEAKRRPRLIVLVLDRSGSMVNNGGSTNLPPAVTNFLGLMKDDAENNEVGIVSFSSFGRVEMECTTNFWALGTNKMYRTDSSSVNLTGMKFGGNTGADEGVRLAIELMRVRKGWDDPQTYKFIVFMTDGEFNITRTLLTAPTWTNSVYLWSNAASVGFNAKTNYYLPFEGNGFTTGLTNAMGKGSANPGTNRHYAQSNTASGSPARFGTNIILNMKPGWVAYHNITSNNVRLRTIWSRHTNSTERVELEPGEEIQLVAPGYVVDGNFAPNTTGLSGITTPNYISRSGYNIFKASDGGEPVGGVYPDGIYYSSFNSGSTYTNIAMTAIGPAGELFYRASGGSTQEIKNLSDWHQNMPIFVTNFYTNAMTNWTSTNGSVRYYAASYTGFAKPANWVEDPDSLNVMPSNNTPGGILYSNSPSSMRTNINVMTINGAPTHYYDFRIGGWSNFTTWSTGAGTMATPMCNWKVLTYCTMARRSDVTIYTVGFDGADANILRAMANDRSATNYTSTLPTGKFYDCNTPQDIVTNFTQIAQQILAFLSK